MTRFKRAITPLPITGGGGRHAITRPCPFSPDNLNSPILYRLMTRLRLMYFYHKVTSDALSVNEKYRNLPSESAGRPVGWSVGGKHTWRDTHFTFQEGFFFFFFFFLPSLHRPELSRSDKHNGFGAVARGETELPIPSWKIGEREGSTSSIVAPTSIADNEA